MINYNNKNVVITGASGGMGRILCRELIKQGAKLSICSNNAEQLEELKQELKGSVFAKVVDITNEAEVATFFEEAYAQNGDFYALANLA